MVQKFLEKKNLPIDTDFERALCRYSKLAKIFLFFRNALGKPKNNLAESGCPKIRLPKKKILLVLIFLEKKILPIDTDFERALCRYSKLAKIIFFIRNTLGKPTNNLAESGCTKIRLPQKKIW